MIVFAPAPAEHQKKERQKAQTLKKSQWWKNQLAKGYCYHCGNRFMPSELTMDHLVPIARGGESTKKNCVPSCRPCNQQRKYFLQGEWALVKMKNHVSSEV